MILIQIIFLAWRGDERMLGHDALTTRRVSPCKPRASPGPNGYVWETPPMNVSKMNHAMFSFALMGGMLVGDRPSARPVSWLSKLLGRKP